MQEITFFTPGQLTGPGPPLAPYRPATPTGALAPYLDAYTQPGDLVIDLFCHNPAFIREAVQAGRRALGLNVNRALLLAAALGLTAVEKQDVVAAFTHLSEARKGVQTLQAHIEGLYRTACAACGAAAVADAFIWERDGQAPIAKRYRCPACGDAPPEGAPTDEADRVLAAHFEARGLSYWLLLDRAAPRHAPHRERIAALLELYTPRNLAALGDLLLKSDGLALAPAVRQAMDALLLDTLDQAASLRPADAPDLWPGRPRRLQRPARYVEANVWRLFERALETWQATTETPVPLATSLEVLLRSTEPAHATAFLAALSSAQAGRQLPPGSAALILVDPPRPDAVLWHLSALWCAWLWGAQASDALTPLLSRRWLDKDWLWRGLRGGFQAVAPLLRDAGRLICLFAAESPVILEAHMLAAAGAGYDLVGWGARAPGELRCTWSFARQAAPSPVQPDALSRAVAERAADASVRAVQVRGEPMAWPLLHAAIYADLAESGLLARAASLPAEIEDPLSWLAETVRSALEGAPLHQLSSPSAQRGDQPLWWTDAPFEPRVAMPLSDRVELAVTEILRDLLAVSEADLERRIHARFPGPQTPPTYLVRLCLFSYGDEHAAGHWRLRAEDELAARAVETDGIIRDLSTLGRRLGFQVTLGAANAREWAVRWLDETGGLAYVFAVSTTAILSDWLPAPPPMESKTVPCLTLPGGRAILVGYKLRHNPWLRQQVERRGWQFLKFRHLRHLVREVESRRLDRHAFRAALGLDPIVEQEEAQLPLW
jgi:hypothetical protein